MMEYDYVYGDSYYDIVMIIFMKQNGKGWVRVLVYLSVMMVL